MLISFATLRSFLIFLIVRRDDRGNCGLCGIVRHACTFLARMWLGILHYVSRFLCFIFFVQSRIIVWRSVFYSSALLKSCNFDVGFLEQMPIPRPIFSDIASLVTCYLGIWREIVRSYAKFAATFVRCVELRCTAWCIKAIIRCSAFSYLSSEQRRLLSW